MHPQLRTLTEQWRANPRLRLGALTILLILLGYAIDHAQRQKQALAQTYGAELDRLQRLEQLQHQTQWQDWAQQARDRRLQLEQKLWQAESRGLAHAHIQNWLKRNLHSRQLDHLRTRSQEAQEIPGQPPLWRVDSEITGELDKPQLLALLGMLELAPSHLKIQALDLSPSRNGHRLSLSFAAWFLAPAEPDGRPA